MRRLLQVAAVVLLPLAITLGVTSAALASNNGVEVCGYFVNAMDINVPQSPCMDDYNNGGALVKSYAPGNTWEYYTVQSTGTGAYEIVDQNKGTCVGDNGNNPSDAKASNNQQCPTSGTAGWGTLFQIEGDSCPNGGFGLHNVHWNGYLNGGAANGSQWFLNNGSPNGCLYNFGG